MRAKVVLLWFLACAAAAELRGADPTDDYLLIYQSIQRADEFLHRADFPGARSAYEEAKASLDQFASRYPGWNERVVQFRRTYITQQLKALPSGDRSATPGDPGAGLVGAAAVDEGGTQLALLRERLHRLSVENQALYSRLQEALSARPSAVDPQELARADEQIRALRKENDLLKVALQKAERPAEASSSQTSQGTEELERSLASARDQLRRQTDRIKALEGEHQVSGSTRMRNSTVTSSAGAAVEALQQELTDQRAKNEILLAEKRILESHVTELATRQGAEIRAQTEGLERELAASRDMVEHREAEVARVGTELRSLRERLAIQDRQNQELQSEVRGLRNSLATAPGDPSTPKLLERIKALELERDVLKRRVETIQAGLSGRASEPSSTPVVAAAGSPPRADQAIETPLLARMLTPRVAEAETAALVGQAQSAANLGRWADAEAAYRQALRRSGRDLALLSGLGAALLAQNRVTEAESALQAVVTARPQDPTAVLMLGVVRLRQRRDDEALMLLSRAAQLDPSSSEAHCYLGQVLDRKGLADPAEKTLRRAVELQPRYGDAHRALARVYAFRQPPSLDLARRHHALAVEFGAVPDTQVEQLLRSGQGAVTSGVR